ncbi:unnamed protein product [Amoebophrya sp. A25]|nr:unnamed protein product [Amoebophrya sp. A25]|eukprot:GSA25T00025394001.1
MAPEPEQRTVPADPPAALENTGSFLALGNPMATLLSGAFFSGGTSSLLSGESSASTASNGRPSQELGIGDYTGINDYRRDLYFDGFASGEADAIVDDSEDPGRVPTFVKVRGLPEQQDPRIQKRKKPKKKSPFAACLATCRGA